jgi:hypothetical protein
MSELLVKLGKNGSEIREMLVQVYGDNAMKKTAVYKWVTRFSEGRDIRMANSKTEVHQIVCENCQPTVRSTAEQANINNRQRNRKILTEDLDMRKLCKHGPKGPAHMALSVREFLASKQITLPEHPPYSPDLDSMTFFCSRK